MRERRCDSRSLLLAGGLCLAADSRKVSQRAGTGEYKIMFDNSGWFLRFFHGEPHAATFGDTKESP